MFTRQLSVLINVALCRRPLPPPALVSADGTVRARALPAYKICNNLVSYFQDVAYGGSLASKCVACASQLPRTAQLRSQSSTRPAQQFLLITFRRRPFDPTAAESKLEAADCDTEFWFQVLLAVRRAAAASSAPLAVGVGCRLHSRWGAPTVLLLQEQLFMLAMQEMQKFFDSTLSVRPHSFPSIIAAFVYRIQHNSRCCCSC